MRITVGAEEELQVVDKQGHALVPHDWKNDMVPSEEGGVGDRDPSLRH